ncbi:DNA polymerase alpha subunit, putative [Babesia ovata]|uniref:DNA polymerase alpha subunit, putative n=1 Tax=Babesia ovata TaxID=189622 RepID=A0A2H6KCQ7_9APIC|nr:DNA polymerase alpha subunit, putative [Babesia ovata]GBE60786.1 DNA polymerase alpha subunit, putative [Babesia ovata]
MSAYCLDTVRPLIHLLNCNRFGADGGLEPEMCFCIWKKFIYDVRMLFVIIKSAKCQQKYLFPPRIVDSFGQQQSTSLRYRSEELIPGTVRLQAHLFEIATESLFGVMPRERVECTLGNVSDPGEVALHSTLEAFVFGYHGTELVARGIQQNDSRFYDFTYLGGGLRLRQAYQLDVRRGHRGTGCLGVTELVGEDAADARPVNELSQSFQHLLFVESFVRIA